MMQTFRTEGNYRDASRLSIAELRAAAASGEILQSTALAFDTRRQLRFDLGGVRGVMPFAACAEGADTGAVRDIAVLTRVGRGRNAADRHAVDGQQQQFERMFQLRHGFRFFADLLLYHLFEVRLQGPFPREQGFCLRQVVPLGL